ncbi:dethiobiotin synthase [Geomonas edaphica]|uniref:dethiobiotin synthase n=1 Tax=Geomonas edaphica TaxID=2570226 RepID=UPI0010A8B399|nr:dethiobiotin synthase [Geomonas edaphica]
MSAKSIFVTGTDTGVGKTIASATIAMLLRRMGHSVGVMKPVTSGCIERDGKLISEDAELLCFGADLPVTPDCTPYLLRAPLAPSVSASQDGVRINFQVIKEAYDRLAQKHEFVIVEGAGGLMVPLAGGLLVADLALHLGLPIVVVARPNLGTINHTLLTTFTARTMGLKVKGVIVNRYPDTPDQAESYAPHMIDSLSGSQLLGLFPDIQGADERETVTRVTDHLLQQPATGIMLREMFD